MKSLSKAVVTGAALISLPLAALSLAPTVSADGTGQIEGGPSTYEIKNLTQNTPYAQTTSANACDELEYSVLLHNSGYEAVNNINVKATLSSAASTSNTSTMTATYTDGVVPSTTATATVNLSSSESINYEAGTTVLYNSNNQVIETLPDTITSSGVNIGNLNGSTTEFLNFKAKVGCPTPAAPIYTCNELNVLAEDNRTVKITDFATTAQNGATFSNAVINWGDNSSNLTTATPVGQTHQYAANGTYTISATAHFNVNGQDETAGGVNCEKVVTFSATTPPTVTPPATTTPSTPAATPTQLVNTGAGSVVGLFAAVSAAGAVAYRYFLGRRLSRQ